MTRQTSLPYLLLKLKDVEKAKEYLETLNKNQIGEELRLCVALVMHSHLAEKEFFDTMKKFDKKIRHIANKKFTALKNERNNYLQSLSSEKERFSQRRIQAAKENLRNGEPEEKITRKYRLSGKEIKRVKVAVFFEDAKLLPDGSVVPNFKEGINYDEVVEYIDPSSIGSLCHRRLKRLITKEKYDIFLRLHEDASPEMRPYNDHRQKFQSGRSVTSMKFLGCHREKIRRVKEDDMVIGNLGSDIEVFIRDYGFGEHSRDIFFAVSRYVMGFDRGCYSGRRSDQTWYFYEPDCPLYLKASKIFISEHKLDYCQQFLSRLSEYSEIFSYSERINLFSLSRFTVNGRSVMLPSIKKTAVNQGEISLENLHSDDGESLAVAQKELDEICFCIAIKLKHDFVVFVNQSDGFRIASEILDRRSPMISYQNIFRLE